MMAHRLDHVLSEKSLELITWGFELDISKGKVDVLFSKMKIAE